jgi:hypothetical protein
MSETFGCHNCPALGPACEGDEASGVHCGELAGWLDLMGGPDLDLPLAPQPAFDLPSFFPQLLNGLEVPAMLAREPAVAVGIAKALTPGGKVSRRAVPARYGTHSLRVQWGIGEETLLVCIGNYLDGYLEKLWVAQQHKNVWGRLQALGFDAAPASTFRSTSTGPASSTWSISSARG